MDKPDFEALARKHGCVAYAGGQEYADADAVAAIAEAYTLGLRRAAEIARIRLAHNLAAEIEREIGGGNG